MKRIVDIAVSHARLTIAVLLFLLAAGALSYMSIPKESQPDVQIPYIYVQLSDRGISPEDAERLLLRPMETQLKTVADVKQMRSAAFEGGGYVLRSTGQIFFTKPGLIETMCETARELGVY